MVLVHAAFSQRAGVSASTTPPQLRSRPFRGKSYVRLAENLLVGYASWFSSQRPFQSRSLGGLATDAMALANLLEAKLPRNTPAKTCPLNGKVFFYTACCLLAYRRSSGINVTEREPQALRIAWILENSGCGNARSLQMPRTLLASSSKSQPRARGSSRRPVSQGWQRSSPARELGRSWRKICILLICNVVINVSAVLR